MERTTTAHATAFEGSRIRGFRGSRFDSRASPRRDHRPWGSGDEQVLVTRSDVGQKGQIKLGEEAARMPNVALSMLQCTEPRRPCGTAIQTASLVVIQKEELDHDQHLIFASTCKVTGEGGQSWRCHIEDSILAGQLAAQQSTYILDGW